MATPTAWRVLTVEEDEGFFKVTAVAYRPDKYCFIERGDPLEDNIVPDFTTPPDPPASVTAQEIQYELNGTVATKIYVSWPSVFGVNNYRVRWRLVDGIFTEAIAFGPSYDILNVTPGTYEIEVYSISPFGVSSVTAATTTIIVGGSTQPPSDPTGLTIVPLTGNTATLSWNLAPDLSVTVGGQVLVRHDPRTVPAANWNDSNPIIAAVPGNATSAIVPLVTGTYFIKFQDQFGNRSVNAASVYTILPVPQPVLEVKSWIEEATTPPFDGTAVNMVFSGPDGGLVLDTGAASTGEYIHKDTFDLENVYALNLRRYLVTGSKIVSGTPTALDIDECRTYYRVTQNNPFSPSGVQWSAWTEYVNAIVQCRAVQLKAIASTASAQVAPIVKNLGGFAELQQRSETGTGSGFALYQVTYSNAFYQTPSLVITPQDMQTGDYYTITNSTRTGFTVEFFDSSNTPVIRSFTYTATGFGSQV